MKLVSFVALFLLAACQATSTDSGSAQREVFGARGQADDLAFSDAILVGDTLYLAGTLGLAPGERQPPASVEEEARLALENFRAKLALADMTMADLVMVQVFCPDVQLYDRFNAVYREFFEGTFPTRSFVGSGPLLFGTHFEINGIAVRRTAR